ncbi:siderophore-interacting protein [Nocardioides sp. HDW12B]|uniref:siderophore-interacting protein n=1 Tax=Nocardioides sp. HDW12B TaxID=2714939 RepID=UPI0014098080|nr:siderophore-interacting protein [Nocardioides sp. HDW12B]QIK67768.1 siderophore-interacting protein [Nocardioides sp. HDW12B]
MTATVSPPVPFVLDEVEVVGVERLSPCFVRLLLGGPAVADIGVDGPFLDQRIKLLLPGPSGALPRLDPHHPDGWYTPWLALPEAERGHLRTYTVRALRPGPTGPVLVVDVVVHEPGPDTPQGPGCRWAATARPGDRVVVVAPRRGLPFGGIEFDPGDAGRVLLVGDETAVPAIASVLEALAAEPTGVSGAAYLEVPSAADVLDLVAPPGLRVTWLPRHGGEHGARATAAVGALFGLPGSVPVGAQDPDAPVDDVWETPTYSASGEPVEDAAGGGDLYAWVAGESGMVRALRRLLVNDAAMPRRQVAFMGYWRRGVAMA